MTAVVEKANRNNNKRSMMMTMMAVSTLLTLLILSLTALTVTVDAFVPSTTTSSISRRHHTSSTTTSTSKTSLFAVSALVRKAKEAELRKQIKDNGGIDDDVMEKYKIIQEALKENNSEDEDGSSNTSSQNKKKTKKNIGMGPLQQNLTRRKGTITVIAEYKRKIADGSNGYIRVNSGSTSKKSIDQTTGGLTEEIKLEVNSPELLSNEFREFGAAGIAILADERMGGCGYKDIACFVEEQRRAHSDVPGPVPIINSDVIVDEIQIAQSAVLGVNAVLLDYELLGKETLLKLIIASRAVDLEIIIAVRTKEEAQSTIDIIQDRCSFMLSVINMDGVNGKLDIISNLQNMPLDDDDESEQKITTIANILHRTDQGLAEVEECWSCRDKGFNCAWISDALYKAGNSASEYPGAIIKSMAAKSSVRWASPVAKSGRGEGAKEYLGDIMM
jgi:indole-3-glycerol phosphate synthase